MKIGPIEAKCEEKKRGALNCNCPIPIYSLRWLGLGEIAHCPPATPVARSPSSFSNNGEQRHSSPATQRRGPIPLPRQCGGASPPSSPPEATHSKQREKSPLSLSSFFSFNDGGPPFSSSSADSRGAVQAEPKRRGTDGAVLLSSRHSHPLTFYISLSLYFIFSA
ncbi:hypothetical protein AXF42_Ash016895 [Apostasia shenzhenica]|uniref:Uncharacterized protein n=1 Tax=Apostasia shenzhenica TaxID=1088818 RepID=A0A2H9ZRF5_9ASPA|nr:hypothetical protein AXF42_Ash016895 [Apostasia shenzhenica]